MAGEALLCGEMLKLLDQARLADASLAADIDRLAVARPAAPRKRRFELMQLAIPAYEQLAA